MAKWLFNISILLLLGCGNQNTTPNKHHQLSDNYEVKCIRHQNGWGYQIKKNKKTLIKQLHIPSIAGNRVFKTKDQAYQVGMLVVDKLKKNTFPPSVSKRELDSLGVDY